MRSSAVNILFRDVTLLALSGVTAIALLMFPWINPPGKDNESDIKTQGDMLVEALWADDISVDIDLWLLAPGDSPVGYSHKSGEIMNLLRDDLGIRQDYSAKNFETAFARGLPDGEYVFNVHLFNSYRYAMPIKCTLNITIKLPSENKIVIRETVEFQYEGEEITVIRLYIEDGKVIDQNKLQRFLRVEQNTP